MLSQNWIVKLKLLDDDDFSKGTSTWERINWTSFNVANILTISDKNKNLLDNELQRISISEDEFKEKVVWKIRILTFPELFKRIPYNLSFYDKLTELLPWTEIIFRDDERFEYRRWINEISIDSDKFELDWNNKKLNLSILKLLKTEPDKEKIKFIDSILPNKSNLFISDELGSHNTATDLIFFMKWSSQKPSFSLNRVQNSTWYLNEAYYSKKIKWAFVSAQYNLMEPLHAWILTINSYSENRVNKNKENHNWLASHFWEKTWLLLLLDWSGNDYEKLQKFKNISPSDFLERKKIFEHIYENEIKPLVYWIIYKFLKTKFPNEITD